MTASNLGNLYMGTSSWTFPDWKGGFYPPEIPARERLNFYASQFNSVEVNTSFYALPAPKTLLQWVESVPPGFVFALKAPREITHDRRLVDVDQTTRAYLDVLRSLGSAAAPGFFQFPPSFSRSREGRRLAAFIDQLAEPAQALPLAVEVRATDLMTHAFARFLAERGIGFVVVERSGQPDTFDCWQEATGHSPAPLPLFLRLIGQDRDPLPDDKEIRRPQDELLDRWAARIAGVLQAGTDVYCYIHNPFEGHSPASVRRLWQRINQHTPLPAWAPPPVPPPDDTDADDTDADDTDTDDTDGQLALF